MRRAAPAVVLTGAAVTLVALFDQGFHAEAASPAPAAEASTGDGTATSGSRTPSAKATASPRTSVAAQSPSAAPSTPAAGTGCGSATEVTGDVITTRWGPVQVVASIAGGVVCAADAVKAPDGDRRSLEISKWAIPELNQQAVDNGNGDISGVSGASYTSYGYWQSLQSALAKAK